MSTFSNSLKGGLAALALMVGSSAFANTISGIDGSINCSSYTIDVAANLVGGFDGTVNYAIHVSTGEEVTGSLPVKTTDPAMIDVTETKQWPNPFTGTVSVTATVTLVSAGQVVDQKEVTQAISVDCPVPVTYEGCSADFWKDCKHFKYWAGVKPNDKFKKVFDVTPSSRPVLFPVLSLTVTLPVPSFGHHAPKPKMCEVSNRFSWHDKDYDKGHKFGHAFGLKGKCKHKVTLLQALKGEGTPEKDLMREGTAALLNAKSELNFQYSEEQVIKMVQGAYSAGNFAEVAEQFKKANEQNCPLK